MTPAVRYEVAGEVATLTMDRPGNRNALTPELLDGLGDGLTVASAEPSVRVVVLTHSGPVFCAGADLKADPKEGAAPVPRFGLPAVLTAIQDAPKPVVARIGGHCLGGGVGLAAACDVSLAADEVQFGFTEVRFGVAPAIISTVCLPKLRRGDALALFLTGERIPAARAAGAGLITAAVPARGLDASLEAVIAKLLAGGPKALAAAKRLVYEVPNLSRPEAFEATAAISEALFKSDEAAEGMTAFREKRRPAWAPAPTD
jgi:methylglutaconyl-CoA hydratase